MRRIMIARCRRRMRRECRFREIGGAGDEAEQAEIRGRAREYLDRVLAECRQKILRGAFERNDSSSIRAATAPKAGSFSFFTCAAVAR